MPVNTTTCDLPNAKATVVTYSTGYVSSCVCAPDPFLKLPQWILCKCPLPSSARKDNPYNIPTISTYTNWPALNKTSPPQSDWPRCTGKYALCSSANCTMDFPGNNASGILLAACGCIIPNGINGLTNNSLVDPAYILDQKVCKAEQDQCPDYTQSTGCGGPNATPVCKAIGNNTIYNGTYDFISTFSSSSQVGGFNKVCIPPGELEGAYAQCMTAACFLKPAFDGSPVTCYCPVYKSTRYLVGSPINVTDSCPPQLPYVLSGVDASS